MRLSIVILHFKEWWSILSIIKWLFDYWLKKDLADASKRLALIHKTSACIRPGSCTWWLILWYYSWSFQWSNGVYSVDWQPSWGSSGTRDRQFYSLQRITWITTWDSFIGQYQSIETSDWQLSSDRFRPG